MYGILSALNGDTYLSYGTFRGLEKRVIAIIANNQPFSKTKMVKFIR